MDEKFRAKLFLFYKIFFSILIIPVVGIVVYSTFKTSEEKRSEVEETYFQDEAEFLKTPYGAIINTYLTNSLTGSEQIKYIKWMPKPAQLREHTDVIRVKYSITRPSGELSINDMAFIVENGAIKKGFSLD